MPPAGEIPSAPSADEPVPDPAATRVSIDTGPEQSTNTPTDRLEADVASLREQVPQLVANLLEQAHAGDAQAARVCLEFLIHEEQRLPTDVATGGAVGRLVKKIMASMSQGKLPPRQALDALKAIETARDLLKKP